MRLFVHSELYYWNRQNNWHLLHKSSHFGQPIRLPLFSINDDLGDTRVTRTWTCEIWLSFICDICYWHMLDNWAPMYKSIFLNCCYTEARETFSGENHGRKQFLENVCVCLLYIEQVYVDNHARIITHSKHVITGECFSRVGEMLELTSTQLHSGVKF